MINIGGSNCCYIATCGFAFVFFVFMVCDEMGFGCFVGRTGELNAAELENLMAVVANPRQFKMPDWFLNRKKDSHVVSNPFHQCCFSILMF
jgi:hypothetical protein